MERPEGIECALYLAGPMPRSGRPPVLHYAAYGMSYKKWWAWEPHEFHEEWFVKSLCGQLPSHAEYFDEPPNRPFCKLCIRVIDVEARKH